MRLAKTAMCVEYGNKNSVLLPEILGSIIGYISDFSTSVYKPMNSVLKPFSSEKM